MHDAKDSAATAPSVLTTGAEIFAAATAARRAGKRVGLVPTMGALHAGHLSLVEAARRECDAVAVTIFVNPTQFGPHEDFARYPRPLANDLKLLAPLAVDWVFAPPEGEIYRPGHSTFVEVGPVSQRLEGALRPGHFRGVATVVLKLFQLVPADLAFFGQKDYQQSLVIRRMTADLDLPIAIRTCPIVREPDGLALSSRNAYLSADERRQALALSRSLRAAADAYARQRDAAAIEAAMHAVLAAEPALAVDYAVLADCETLEPIEKIGGPCVALVAARVGRTRLIDNQLLE
jgi:pantoate--beta-alanine ligase